jgi:hypothetical protein
LLGAPRSTPPVAHNSHNLATCRSYNGDLVVVIIEVIAENTILMENHLISLEDLFGLNPMQLEKFTGN